MVWRTDVEIVVFLGGDERICLWISSHWFLSNERFLRNHWQECREVVSW